MPEQIHKPTPKLKEKYILIRDAFHEKRNGLKNKIQEHQSEIDSHKEKIISLEKEVNNSRPTIEGCERKSYTICKRCDVYSMEFEGRTPDQDKTFWYKCVICGYEDSHT